jgi:surface protein
MEKRLKDLKSSIFSKVTGSITYDSRAKKILSNRDSINYLTINRLAIPGGIPAIADIPTTTTTSTTTTTTTAAPTTTTSTTTTTTTTLPPTNFISTWRTTTDNESITLPYSDTGAYSGTIDWGDGTTSTNSYANRTHAYITEGDYIVTINGTINGWSFGINSDFTNAAKILSVTEWGDSFRLGNSGGYFQDCTNLNLNGVTDILNLSGTIDLSSIFLNCTSLTIVGRMNEWDVSSVTNMNNMFRQALVFNQNIGNWNVSSVTNMNNMFERASAFNNGGSPDINNWNTSNITDMGFMFDRASVFNQPIGNWDVSNVTSMIFMFRNALAFNRNIGAWDVSSVTNMTWMFGTAIAFNNGGSPDINNWNVSAVTDMSYMFSSALQFNQPIGNWNVSNVTNMEAMFFTARLFNQNIGNWNVSNVTSMNSMFFEARAFNNGGSSTIGNWNVSNVIDMGQVFQDARAFNQPIGSWNVSSVTNMVQMFSQALVFNQDLSSWCVSLIPTTPSDFATGAIAWVLPKPVWGTCPTTTTSTTTTTTTEEPITTTTSTTTSTTTAAVNRIVTVGLRQQSSTAGSNINIYSSTNGTSWTLFWSGATAADLNYNNYGQLSFPNGSTFYLALTNASETDISFGVGQQSSDFTSCCGKSSPCIINNISSNTTIYLNAAVSTGNLVTC